MYSGGSGLSIDIHFELSYDVLSPLPIVLSKHFNHPHPYIEIATAISDIYNYVSDVNRRAFHEDIQKAQRDSESTACSNKRLY